MNLSAVCIINHLPFPVSASIRENASNALSLGRPVFLADQIRWPEHHICLCQTIPEQLKKKPVPQDILVFFLKKEDRFPLTVQNRFCPVPANVSLLSLFNQLQALFDRYDAWDEQLKSLLQKHAVLSAFLDCSQDIFQNPLLLQAADYFLIAHSSMIDDHPDMQHLIDPNDSYDTITTSKLDPNYMDARIRKDPFYLPSYLSGCRELCVNLFRHEVFSHRLILAEKLHTISEEDEPFLVHLAGYIDLSLGQESEEPLSKNFSLDATLSSIIEEKLTDHSLISTQLAEFGWNSQHTYCCMTLKGTSLDSQNLTSHYLCHHFEKIVPGSCAFPHREELIVYINLSRYENSLNQLLNNITPFLRDSFLKTGVSNTVKGTDDLRYCYLQAKHALEIGSKYQNYRWVHRFSNISILYLMDCCIRDMPPHMVCSEKLLALQRYDQKHNSQYSETLRVYLETHLNAVHSSKKLFIHRSTFLYRLERIQEIIDIDFDDEESLFYLQISYHILGLLGLQNTDYTSPQ